MLIKTIIPSLYTSQASTDQPLCFKSFIIASHQSTVNINIILKFLIGHKAFVSLCTTLPYICEGWSLSSIPGPVQVKIRKSGYLIFEHSPPVYMNALLTPILQHLNSFQEELFSNTCKPVIYSILRFFFTWKYLPNKHVDWVLKTVWSHWEWGLVNTSDVRPNGTPRWQWQPLQCSRCGSAPCPDENISLLLWMFSPNFEIILA